MVASKKHTRIAVTGSKLKSAKILYPKGIQLDVTDDETYAEFDILGAPSDGLKQIVFQIGGGAPPAIVPLPEAKSAVGKPTLNPHDPIIVGAGVTYSIGGSLLDSLTCVRYLGKQLAYSLALDKRSINVKLPDEITSTPGIRRLELTFSDGSTQPLLITVTLPTRQ